MSSTLFLKPKDKYQKDHILESIKNKISSKGPYSVHLDLTNHCNNDCISCWSFSPLVGFATMDKETRSQKLPFEIVKKAIDQLAEMGTREIYFTGGGEPFMHPQALELMKYVKEMDMYCDMSTNCTLFNKEKLTELVKHKVDHIHCSIWAGSQESFEATHPNKSGDMFDHILEMLQLLQQIKKEHNSEYPKLTIYHVLSTKNYKDIVNMLELAYKVKADFVECVPTDVVPGYTDELMLDDAKSYWLRTEAQSFWNNKDYYEKKHNHNLVFKNYDQLIRRLMNKTNEGKYDVSIIGKIPCYAGYTFLRILATGEVNSCLKSGRIPIGSLYTDDIKTIWNNKRQQTFRKHTLHYDVHNPYFHMIGNTTQKGNGCLYSCDNLGWNLIFHDELSKNQ